MGLPGGWAENAGCLEVPALACFPRGVWVLLALAWVGRTCLERDVVPWVYEIEPLMGRRVWRGAQDLGAWF